MTEFSRVATDIYPTRYAAFDNPGSWAVFTPVEGRYRSCRADGPVLPVRSLGVCAVAVFSGPDNFDGLWAGVYVEIIGRLEGDNFAVNCHYTAPDIERTQTNKRIVAGTLEDAMKQAEEWICAVKGAANE